MSETSTAARPDLSALSREVRVNVAVAETLGATLEKERSCFVGRFWWTLAYPDGRRSHLLSASETDPADAHAVEPVEPFIDYLHDPAARGALMEKERIDVRYNENGTVAARASFYRVLGALQHPPRWAAWLDQPSTGEAVCCAVLAKHGIDWDTLEPVA